MSSLVFGFRSAGLPDQGVGFTMPVLGVVGSHGVTAILTSPCLRGKLLTHARHAHAYSSPRTREQVYANLAIFPH
jgi:hypothetical protein